MTTPLDIITLSLKDIGVLGSGQTPEAEDTNDAFTTLNQMISEWARKRWLIYRLTTLGFTSTGSQTYTVGPGGNYPATERPARIESAFVRFLNTTAPNQIDQPLGILQSREDYNRIGVKSLGTVPYLLWYDPVYPQGLIYPWPIPQAALYAVYISFQQVLPRFATLQETLVLPPEYESALRYNLGARLYASYDMPVKPAIVALALSCLNTIRGANAAIATLQMPSDLVRRGLYNVYSDRYY